MSVEQVSITVTEPPPTQNETINNEIINNDNNDINDNNDKEETQQGGKGKGNRSFKVKLQENGPLFGRYNGESPYQAANKALSEIIRNRVKHNESDTEEIRFFLQESTKNSSKKQHEYTGYRTKLEKPVEYAVANGQTIKKEYKNVLRKVKKTKGGTTATATPVIVATNTTDNETTVTITTEQIKTEPIKMESQSAKPKAKATTKAKAKSKTVSEEKKITEV